MLDAYALPRHFESEELATLLLALTPRQRRVLRAYVARVELGGQPVTIWLADPQCPVTERSWYKAGSRAQYKNCPGFQQALEAYLRAAVKAGTAEEAKAIARAKRTLRLGAARAAERLVELVDRGEKHDVQVKAAVSILDRADMETASKGEVEVSDARERLARLLGTGVGDGAEDAAEGADPGGAGEPE